MHLRIFNIIGIRPLMVCGMVFYDQSVGADWHAALSVSSEYAYRGYSKSYGEPAAQADLSYHDDTGWFSGAAVSQVNFGHRTNQGYASFEFKPYLGINLPHNEDWRTELSGYAYVYDNLVFGQEVDYVEFLAALHYQDSLSAKIFVAPDAYQHHVSLPTYELNFRRDFSDTAQFSAGLGYSQAYFLLGQDYFYWNIGVSWFLTRYLALDIRYVDVDLDKYSIHSGYQYDFYPRPLQNNYLLTLTLGF